MKIIHVNPGILPIPPKNWGAIERAIWNYHLNFTHLGFESEIKYLDEIKNDNISNVHIHVTNLANIAHSRGIEYFFSMHDHHVLFDYPNTDYLNQTRAAIKNSIKTIIHSPVIFTHKNFIDLSEKFIYLPHGADQNIYKNKNTSRANTLLCVGSNGFINHPTFDRKGFLLAKYCAEYLNLDLTICSPSSNKQFFENNNFLQSKNITIKYDLTELELVDEYNTHKVFLHPSMLEAGDPNLTLIEAHFCGMYIVGSYHGNRIIDGMNVVNDLTPTSYIHAIQDALKKVENEIPINTEFTWENISKSLVGIYKKHGNTLNKFTSVLLDSYSSSANTQHTAMLNPKIDISYYMTPRVDIKSYDEKLHEVKFVASDNFGNDTVVYNTSLSGNMWAKPNANYYKNWKVYLDGQLKYQTNIDISKNVCAVISTYPNSEDVKNKTVSTMLNIEKNIGLTTICATHIDYGKTDSDANSLKSAANHYVLDLCNTLTKQSYYVYYHGVHDGYRINLNFRNTNNDSYHGPAVHQNYYNGVKRAKELGYKYAMLTNFDMLYSTDDIDKIKCVLNTVLVNNANGFFLYTQDPEGPTYKTVWCVVNVDTFLSTFPHIKNENDYNEWVLNVGSESNGLENLYYHTLKNTEKIITENIREDQFFNSKHCFTNSQTDYFAVLPLNDNPQANAAIFIKRANKDVPPYSIFIKAYKHKIINDAGYYVDTHIDDEIVINEQYGVETEFYKIIPFSYQRNDYVYTFYLSTTPEHPEKSIVIKPLDDITLNGVITHA